MKYLNSLLWFFSIGCLFSNLSIAATKEAESTYATTKSDFGWLPSIGVGFGHLDQSGHSESDGENATLELFASYNYPKSSWVTDAGLGFQRQYFSETGSVFLGLATLAGRYQIDKTWSVGPMVDMFFGHGSPYGTAQSIIFMPGMIASMDIHMSNDQMIKLGFKYTSELGQSGQTSTQLGLVATWSIGSANSLIKSQGIASQSY